MSTLNDFAGRFLNDYARANRQKPSGISQKEIALRVHLKPQSGGTRLDAITTSDVQRLKDAMRAKSAKTVNNVLTVLSKLLKVAVEWGEIEQMPCSVRLLKATESPSHLWDFDESKRLIAAANALGTAVLAVVLVGGDAGLRAGEILALEWTDIDLKARRMHVARSDWRG